MLQSGGHSDVQQGEQREKGKASIFFFFFCIQEEERVRFHCISVC